MSKSKSSPTEANARPRVSKWTFAALGLAIVVFGARWIHEARRLRAEPVTEWTESVTADCGLVLTGGPGRIRAGMALLSDGKIKKLIVSGVHPDSQLREIFPNWLFYTGLREDDVILEKRSETTWGNAQQSLPIVEALHCRDLVIVTSQIHMPRAFRTFRSVFPPNIQIRTQAVVGTRFVPSVWELSVEALKSIFYSVWAY